MRPPSGALWLTRLVILTIAATWAWAALNKLIAIRDAGSATTLPEWLRSSWVWGPAVAVEILVASLLASGSERAGLVLGLCLLAAYSSVLVLVPNASACGCGLDLGADPLARNAFLGSLHVLGFALICGLRTDEAQD